MTNRVALGLLFTLLLVYVAATLVIDEPGVFLGRKFLDLLTAVAFWR